MGSSLPATHAALLAVTSGVLYLIFDAGRYFLHHISPVRLRQWSGSDPRYANGSRWFQYNKQHFSLVSGMMLQIAMIASITLTFFALSSRGAALASIVTAIVWLCVSIGWKFVLALAPAHTAESAIRFLIPFSHVIYYLFWPILFPLREILRLVGARREEDEDDEDATDEEVQAYIDVGEEEGILEEGEGKLIQSIVEFGDRIVREVMTPRVDLFAVDSSTSFDELVRLFDESKFSRIVVYQQDIDHVVGFVHVKDAFSSIRKEESPEIRNITRPALFVAETKKVAELLRELQLERQQIALVVDEYGGTAGLVALEDLLEEIVGEILDEHEDPDEQSWIEIDDGVYLVSGIMEVEALEALTGTTLAGEEDDFETVAGLIFKETGRIPKMGETVTRSGLRFEVDRVDRKRIHRVKVTSPARVETGESIA
jgi:CBS domain containing-hemolysin-like protein